MDDMWLAWVVPSHCWLSRPGLPLQIDIQIAHNTGLALIFLVKGSNPGLLHARQ